MSQVMGKQRLGVAAVQKKCNFIKLSELGPELNLISIPEKIPATVKDKCSRKRWEFQAYFVKNIQLAKNNLKMYAKKAH